MKLLLTAAALIAMAAFAVLVWPTEWQTHVMRSDGTDRLFRVHRLNGTMEVMTRTGWRRSTRTVVDSSKLPALSCSDYRAMQAKGRNATLYADVFYRLPTNCPQ